ncbi:PadR family transcriptional regulator [Methanorbis furvi]|uniref:Transcription regulator PadR N-terminal domain-containing protein n=1 Tax=Methanorbis furvi TaxID=3028299 RepID=A0AAE4MDF3_9EURY|nr:hypothetical protein [Methanocorpusculaceae archaeon Ag1]
MFDKTQLMKGTLEGCILKIIGQETTYGYEIMEKLIHYGFTDVREGTIYPLLVRLEKKNLIESEYRTSPLGPSRKYYHLTKTGSETAAEFVLAWQEISHAVDRILTEEK